MTDHNPENDETASYDVVVIGSGPAGLSAALAAAESGVSVLLCERLRTFGLKLLASGGGKCNVSNILDKTAFLNAFGREGRFLKPALDFAYHDWLFPFLKQWNVPLKLENQFHYFPVSERAGDILNAFLNAFQNAGGTRKKETEVTDIIVNDGKISGVTLNDGKVTECRCVILASGGTAWPKLGGTESGLNLAAKLGHSIAPIYPAMAPLLIRDQWVRSLTGISLPDSELSFRRGHTRFHNRGELLFTHEGFSGPCAIDLAASLAESCNRNGGETTLLFRADASRDAAFWRRELDLLRTRDGKKLVRTLLAGWFPHALSDAFCRLAGCYDRKISELTAPLRERLCTLLSETPLTAIGAGPMEKAMAMKGGVKLREINPKTLESRLVKGLFFAGEIMDLVGPCGGYNIQWALSSGRLAGSSAGAAVYVGDGQTTAPRNEFTGK